MTDRELRGLLARLRAREPEALAALYTELSTPVNTVLLRITRDPWLAEDLLQDFFLRLWEAPPEEAVGKPRAYLFQTARNLALDALRRERRTLSLEDCEPPAVPGPDAQRGELEQAMNALSEEDRQLVTLHLNAGLKFRELSGLLGRPVGTLYARYRRALRVLREQLKGDSR